MCILKMALISGVLRQHRMCSNPSQRQRLINTTETRVNVITNGDSDSAAKAPGRRGLDNGTGVSEQGLNGRCRLQRLHSGTETGNESDEEENKNDAETEEDGSNGPMVPFRVPGTVHVTGNRTLNELGE